MKLEYDVKVLKYKIQSFLIEHKKDYDKFVKESEAEEAYLASKNDLKEKQEALDDWLKGWDKEALFDALTKVETRFITKKGWFWNKQVEERYLVSKPLEDLPPLPEGLHWGERDYQDTLNKYVCIYPSDLFNSGVQQYVPSEIKMLYEIDLYNCWVEYGNWFYELSNNSNSGVFEIYTKTLPYDIILPYKPPFNLEQLLEKVLLAEKSDIEKVVLEDKDLDVLEEVL